MSLYISSTHNGSTFFHLVWVTYTIYAADRMNKRGSKIASRARQKSNYNPPSRGVGRCHLLLAAAANKWCARRKFKGSRKLGLVHLLPLLPPRVPREKGREGSTRTRTDGGGGGGGGGFDGGWDGSHASCL